MTTWQKARKAATQLPAPLTAFVLTGFAIDAAFLTTAILAFNNIGSLWWITTIGSLMIATALIGGALIIWETIRIGRK